MPYHTFGDLKKIKDILPTYIMRTALLCKKVLLSLCAQAVLSYRQDSDKQWSLRSSPTPVSQELPLA